MSQIYCSSFSIYFHIYRNYVAPHTVLDLFVPRPSEFHSCLKSVAFLFQRSQTIHKASQISRMSKFVKTTKRTVWDGFAIYAMILWIYWEKFCRTNFFNMLKIQATRKRRPATHAKKLRAFETYLKLSSECRLQVCRWHSQRSETGVYHGIDKWWSLFIVQYDCQKYDHILTVWYLYYRSLAIF